MTEDIFHSMEPRVTNAMKEITYSLLLQIEEWHGRTKSSSRGCRGACSLRSKRFRGVWGQRKTEERDFDYFTHEENGARTKTERWGYRPVILCSRTPQKRLLRRLRSIQTMNCSRKFKVVPETFTVEQSINSEV